MMFHRHKWGTVAERYTTPRSDLEMERPTVDLAEKALFGITTVTQECERCGKSRSYVVAGKAGMAE